MKKKIIIGVPHHFDFSKLIQKNLEFLGFEVINISYDRNDFQYASITDKIINFGRKSLIGDRNYKESLIFNKFGQESFNKIANIQEKVDYAFLIRPDLFPKKFIYLIKSKTHNLIGYQWDGFDRYPEIRNYLSLFDKFFVFEKKDINIKNGLIGITNFYFDFDEFNYNNQIINDVYFVGSHVKCRINDVNKLSIFFSDKQIVTDLRILSNENQSFYHHNIRLIKNYLTYQENILALQQSKCSIDLINYIHKGLSFRTFEALKYRKKLITNNSIIKNYDIYKHQNIFDLTSRNWEELETFISSPYEPISDNLYEKYSFTNWIKNILDIQPYIEITLPNDK
ncbi:MAG: hypothetical protein Q4G27_03550 [Flavobacteriaceae bacterium]|nr:hypothetical protein [Flavobacteriaceae bacterium]